MTTPLGELSSDSTRYRFVRCRARLPRREQAFGFILEKAVRQKADAPGTVQNCEVGERGKMAEFRAEDLAFREMAESLAYENPLDDSAGSAVDQVPSEDRRALPSFFIIGPPRTGSSWLHEILSPHTLLPSPSKETRFFDTHFHRGLKWYLAHYKNSIGERCMGEVAPTYFASAQARERMAVIVPDAKIVCVFRNPVERLLSLYRLKSAYGMIRASFEEAIESDPEFMESSIYARNLRQWQQHFGARNVMVGIYDDLCEHPQSFADSVGEFIGISRFVLKPSQCEFLHGSKPMTRPRSYFRTRSAMVVAEWLKAQRLDRLVVAIKRTPLRKLALGGGPPFPPVPEDVLKWLYKKLRPEVEELEEMLQRDLFSWKS